MMGRWSPLRAVHSKSVRLDDFTLNVIMEYRGDNFSEKLRNYVFDVEYGEYKNCNTKVTR